MLDDITRTQAPDADQGTRTFGAAGGTASFPNGPASVESVPLPAIPGFEVLELVGRGGMGLVFKAKQLATGRVVALKMIVTGELANTAARDRFKSEITATAKLSHPHIVQLFEAGEADGRAFLVCEFVGGGSLAARLDGTPWDAKLAARMIVPIARAVASAHQSGIVHRDLKPANILLDTAFAPKLADFGIAKHIGDAADAATHTGAILGTPSYMAPEQAGGAKSAGPAADVYGLGAILYELITGRPPFKGADFVETLDQVRKQEPVSPRILQPKLPRDIETICLKCLQKDPAKRYSSADALAEDLERFLEGKPIAARPVSGIERAWRWTKRNPAVSGLLAAAFLILIAGTAVSAFFALRAEAERKTAEGERNTANDREKEANTANERLRVEQDHTRNLLYISQMNAASVALGEGRIPRLLQLLEDTTPKADEPDLRGWEWHYFDRLTRASGWMIPLYKPGERLHQPALPFESQIYQPNWWFSRDCSRAVHEALIKGVGASAFERQFVVFDAAQGRILEPKFGTSATNPSGTPVIAPTFTPDGHDLAAFAPLPDSTAQGQDRWRNLRLLIWDTATGRPLPAPELNVSAAQARSAPITRFDADSVEWLEREFIPAILGFGMPADLLMQLPTRPDLFPRYSTNHVLVRWNRRTGRTERIPFRAGSDTEGSALLDASPSGFAVFKCTPPGRSGFVGNEERMLECWDLRGEPKRVQRVASRAAWIEFSPSGSCIAALSETKLTLITTGAEGRAPQIHTLPGTAESLRLGAVSDTGVVSLIRPGSLMVVDFRGIQPLVRSRHHRDGLVYTTRFRPGGVTLLAVCGEGPSIREWDFGLPPIPSGEPVPKGEFINYPSPDQKWMVRYNRKLRWSANPDDANDVQLVESASGKLRCLLHVPDGELVTSVVFLPSGRNRVLIESMPRGAPAFEFNPARQLSCRLFDFDGKLLFTERTDGGFGRMGFTRPGRGRSISLSAKAQWILMAAPEGVTVRSPESGAVVGQCRVPAEMEILNMATDEAERRVVVAARVRNFEPAVASHLWMQLFELPTCRPVWKEAARPPWGEVHDGFGIGSRELEFAGEHIVAGGQDEKGYRAWIGNAADGSTIHSLAGPAFTRTAGVQPFISRFVWLDEAKKRIAIVGDKEVFAWDMAGGERLAAIRGHDDPVTSVGFSSDGRRLFTLESSTVRNAEHLVYGGTERVRVWDVATSRLVATILCEPDEIVGRGRISLHELSFKDHILRTSTNTGFVFDGTPAK